MKVAAARAIVDWTEKLYTQSEREECKLKGSRRNLRSTLRWSHVIVAIAIKPRFLPRSSSTHEPSDPPLRVVYCGGYPNMPAYIRASTWKGLEKGQQYRVDNLL